MEEYTMDSPKTLALERKAWNRCRYVPENMKGHYESYFQRANHPQRPLAFWIRYTVFSAKGNPGDAVGELWAIYFDGERNQITAAKETFPMDTCRFSSNDLEVHIGEALLNESYLEGQVKMGSNTLLWDLQYTGSEPPLLLLPQSFYESSFPKAKAMVGTPNATFNGSMMVNGESVPIDRWIGSQNHNWGEKHTDSYAWGQVAGFDNAPDAFLECSTARIRLGPVWSPPLTFVVLRLGDDEIRFNSIVQSLRARGSFDFSSWRIDSGNSRTRVILHIHAPKSAFVGLIYNNPPGGTKICLNTKLASCELILKQQGEPERTLIARQRAAFEILTERKDHAVPIIVNKSEG
jgi:hypothetical protein